MELLCGGFALVEPLLSIGYMVWTNQRTNMVCVKGKSRHLYLISVVVGAMPRTLLRELAPWLTEMRMRLQRFGHHKPQYMIIYRLYTYIYLANNYEMHTLPITSIHEMVPASDATQIFPRSSQSISHLFVEDMSVARGAPSNRCKE